MADLSIDEVWDDTRRFFLREKALLLPIGFATFGLAALLGGLVVPAPQAPQGQLPAGPWMLALPPILLLVLTGYLALSRIALRSRMSVAEAIRDAFRLLPRAVVLVLAIGLIFLALSLVAGLLAGVVSMVSRMSEAGMFGLALLIFLPPAVMVSIRFALLWPTLADQEGTIRATFVRGVTLTQGHALKIGGLLLAYFLFYLLMVAVLESAIGSVLIILARLIGAPSLGLVLVAVLIAAFNAVYMTFWTVFLARLYARLAGSIKGI